MRDIQSPAQDIRVGWKYHRLLSLCILWCIYEGPNCFRLPSFEVRRVVNSFCCQNKSYYSPNTDLIFHLFPLSPDWLVPYILNSLKSVPPELTSKLCWFGYMGQTRIGNHSYATEYRRTKEIIFISRVLCRRDQPCWRILHFWEQIMV